MVTLQWTLTLDGLITSGTILTLLGFLWRISISVSSRLTRIEVKMLSIEEKADLAEERGKKIEGAIVSIAEQNRRLNFLEKLVDELRHGEGKVLPLVRGAYEHPRDGA